MTFALNNNNKKLLILNFSKMKKIVFCLLAISMTAFASASNVKPVPVKKEAYAKVKKTAVKKLIISSIISDKEFKRVFCAGYSADGSYASGYYDCFFCWGGSHDGCLKANGLTDN